MDQKQIQDKLERIQREVNQVIRGKENVVERVLAAIKELNYHPNLLAKSLATNETRHVIMLVDNLQKRCGKGGLSGIRSFLQVLFQAYYGRAGIQRH